MKSAPCTPFLRGALASAALTFSLPHAALSQEHPKGIVSTLETLALTSPDYHDITVSPIQWKPIDRGFAFAAFDIYRGKFTKELVDRIAAIRIDPHYQRIKVITGYHDPEHVLVGTIEEWHTATNASALFNSAQYEADPYWKPCGMIISDGRTVGSQDDPRIRGMLVSEPSRENLPAADILDFTYDSRDLIQNYTQGVAHWPIILDRNGTIRVTKTDWQANRTVVAKDRNGNILTFTTEGGFFTLYNFGRFLKEHQAQLNIHTAMNMDGGYEAEMLIQKNGFRYLTYGQFETYGPHKNATIPNARQRIPTVIGIFPRE